MVNFPDWLANELKSRGLSPADLSRLSGKAPAVISRILNGERKPAPQTLDAIAHALHIQPDEVFRQAGYLPPVPVLDEQSLNFLALLPELDKDDIDDLYALALSKVKRKKAQKTS